MIVYWADESIDQRLAAARYYDNRNENVLQLRRSVSADAADERAAGNGNSSVEAL